MNDAQKELSQKLEEATNNELALIYSALVDAVDRYDPSSSNAVPDIMALSHFARELMNSFPHLIDGGAPIEQGHSGHDRGAIDRLKEILKKEPYSIATNHSDLAYESVPAAIALAVSGLSEEVNSSSYSARASESYAVLGYIDSSDPALIPWKTAHKFFVSFTHFKQEGHHAPPAKSEVEDNLRLIENALNLRLGKFFDAKKGLGAIIDAANTVDEAGNYREPEKSLVLEALSRIGDQNLKAAFFSSLNNPLWMKQLVNCGAFAQFPTTDSGGQFFLRWPESRYLRTVATDEPELVSSVLIKASSNNNPYVRDAIIDIACNLPDNQLSKLGTHIVNWASDGYRADSFFWGADEVFELLDRLKDGGDNSLSKSYRKLAGLLFEPRNNDGSSHFVQVISLINRHIYNEKLQQFLCSLEPQERVFFCCRRLITLTTIHEDQLGNNTSGIWIPSIKQECMNPDSEIASALVSQLVSALRIQIEDQASIEKQLSPTATPIVLRCAMYALVSSHEKGISLDPYRDEIAKLLLSETVVRGTNDAEYYPLLNIALSLGYIPFSVFFGLVIRISNDMAAGPSMGNIDLTSGDSDSSIAKEHSERWLQRTLALVDECHLDKEGTSRLGDLNSKYGIAEPVPELVGRTDTITGPNSPISENEMSSMAPTKLLAWLRNWHPTSEDRFQLITHEGQGRSLSRVIADNPNLFHGYADELLELRPTYQRHVIEGWSEAAKKGKDIPIRDFLLLAEHIVEYKSRFDYPFEGDRDFDDDASFDQAKRSLAYGIEQVLISGCDLDNSDFERMLRCILILLEVDDSSSLPDKTIQRDPLLAALNLTGALALTDLEIWIGRSPVLHEPALRSLELRLPESNVSLVNSAALARGFFSLSKAEPQWLEAHYDQLFGDLHHANPCQKLLLTSILIMYRTNFSAFIAIRRAMETALSNGADDYIINCSLHAETSCRELIGEWLYVAAVQGLITLDDDLIRKWQVIASDKQLGDALAASCTFVERTNPITPQIDSAIKRLWDYHSNTLLGSKGPKALRGIVALVRSGHFKPDWWGSRAIKQFEEGTLDNLALFPKDALIELSKYSSRTAVSLLRLIVTKQNRQPYYIDKETMLVILRKAKNDSAGLLDETARKCVDVLGKAGFIDLDDELGF